MTIPDFGVSVTSGPIKINSIQVVACHEDVVVLRADLKAKYAVVAGSGGHAIDLEANEDTLNVQKSKRACTTVRFDGLDDTWHVEALMTGRYTATFVLTKDSRRPLLVWP